MATIASNGTGGGNWSAGATWNGGSVPTSADIALLKDGDTVTHDRVDTSQAVLGIQIEEGATLIVGTNQTLWAGYITYASGGRDPNGVRDLQVNGGSTLIVGGGTTMFWQHIRWRSSGTSLSAMATIKSDSESVRRSIYVGSAEDDTNTLDGPLWDLEYCVIQMLQLRPNHNTTIAGWPARFYRCILRNCQRNSGFELIDCIIEAPFLYNAHYVGTNVVEGGHAMWDRCGIGFSGFTESPFTPTGSSVQTIYGSGLGVFRNCYAASAYTDASLNGWYGFTRILASVPAEDVLAMGRAQCMIHGNGNGEWGLDYFAEAPSGSRQLQKVTDPYAGAAQGEVLRFFLGDTSVKPWGRRSPIEFEIPVEHGDGIAPTIKLYVPSGWTGIADEQIEFFLDPSDEWGLRERQYADVSTTDSWQTITFTGGTATRSSGDKGTIVLRIWVSVPYVAAKYLYFDDLKANLS